MQNIIELFKGISKPYIQKEGGEKLEAIQAWLKERGIKSYYLSGAGLIVNPIENPRIVLVSHMDLIKLFHKGFEENKVCKIEGDEIVGALDNTITNAVALLAYERLLKEGVLDVELFLSEGEEQGMWGMRQWCKTFYDKGRKTFFVNLDVTNEGYNSYCSVEYDKPCFTILKQLQSLLPSGFFTEHRVGDDIDAINSAGFYGFSYCLPTKGYIHSYENKAKLSSLEPYYEGLIKVLTDLETDNCDNVFKRKFFEQALKSETLTQVEESKNDYSKEIKDSVDYIIEYADYEDKDFAEKLKEFFIDKATKMTPFTDKDLENLGMTKKEVEKLLFPLIKNFRIEQLGNSTFAFVDWWSDME